ncbi:hypothetical protein B5S30_g2048 [[Candida] boidinii]|nr:hypothetical protein B5S30_g2048 [[Candida] boidinii]
MKREPVSNINVKHTVQIFTDILIENDPSIEKPLNAHKEENLEQFYLDSKSANGQLFKGIFNNFAEAVIDTSDGIPRCANCHWEVHGTVCLNCNRRLIYENGDEEDEDDLSDFVFGDADGIGSADDAGDYDDEDDDDYHDGDYPNTREIYDHDRHFQNYAEFVRRLQDSDDEHNHSENGGHGRPNVNRHRANVEREEGDEEEEEGGEEYDEEDDFIDTRELNEILNASDEADSDHLSSDFDDQGEYHSRDAQEQHIRQHQAQHQRGLEQANRSIGVNRYDSERRAREMQRVRALAHSSSSRNNTPNRGSRAMSIDSTSGGEQDAEDEEEDNIVVSTGQSRNTRVIDSEAEESSDDNDDQGNDDDEGDDDDENDDDVADQSNIADEDSYRAGFEAAADSSIADNASSGDSDSDEDDDDNSDDDADYSDILGNSRRQVSNRRTRNDNQRQASDNRREGLRSSHPRPVNSASISSRVGSGSRAITNSGPDNHSRGSTMSRFARFGFRRRQL